MHLLAYEYSSVTGSIFSKEGTFKKGVCVTSTSMEAMISRKGKNLLFLRANSFLFKYKIENCISRIAACEKEDKYFHSAPDKTRNCDNYGIIFS